MTTIERHRETNAPRRFVVLEHRTVDGIHWDLLLETDSQSLLTTWSFEPLGLPIRSFSILANRLPGHRRVYLDFEGPISGNRGTVRQIDAGLCEISGENRLQLFGKIFYGILECAVSTSDAEKHVLAFIPKTP